jgi:hypothetical protein
VSRVTRVHTAVRNCTRDEGGSFGFGNQVLIPSYRKLLRSNAMVVNEVAHDVSILLGVGRHLGSQPRAVRGPDFNIRNWVNS